MDWNQIAGPTYKRVRRRLRVAVTRRNRERAKAAVDEFFDTFNRNGWPYPDDWHEFEDARLALVGGYFWKERQP